MVVTSIKGMKTKNRVVVSIRTMKIGDFFDIAKIGRNKSMTFNEKLMIKLYVSQMKKADWTK